MEVLQELKTFVQEGPELMLVSAITFGRVIAVSVVNLSDSSYSNVH